MLLFKCKLLMIRQFLMQDFCLYHLYFAVLIFLNPVFSPAAYWSARVVLFDAKLQLVVQVDISASEEMERVEREDVGCSQSVSLHRYGLVNRVGAPCQKHT